jgi:hypothetical protein
MTKKAFNKIAEGLHEALDVAKKDAEIVRLRGSAVMFATWYLETFDEMFALKHDLDSYMTINADLATENVRLRAEIGKLRDLVEDAYDEGASDSCFRDSSCFRESETFKVLYPPPPPCDVEGV